MVISRSWSKVPCAPTEAICLATLNRVIAAPYARVLIACVNGVRPLTFL